MQAVRRIYCKSDEEHKELQSMAKFLANLEWSEKETDAPTTWLELFVCYKMMGGTTKGDDAKEEELENRCTIQQAMKDSKRSLKKTAKLAMQERRLDSQSFQNPEE